MPRPALLRRSLASSQLGPALCLDALRWPTPLGAGLRLYFGRGTRVEDVGAAPDGPVQVSQIVPVAGSLIVSGSAPTAEGPVTLQIADTVHTITPSAPETGLFDDRNVIVAQRHAEAADEIAQWLAFHVKDHGADAALLVNRAEPGPDSDAFAEVLAGAAGAIDGLRCILLVDAPVPLGLQDQPALGDPATAPRATGAKAASDPWRAPLAQPMLYDLLKWRFLSRAGAVVALDPCDLLDAPADGIGLFETCRQSQTGLVPVLGETVFAWRIRKGRRPAHGDHICRTDPPTPAPPRWCVAPKRTGPDALWLPHKIAGLTATADDSVEYKRAASVLFPRSKPADLVDKQRLAEAPGLLQRATARLGHDPVRPPERPEARAMAPVAPPTGRTVIVTCMKNEGPFILEWLAYHRMIGVDDFLIYTNDCDDGTDAMLDLLQARGMVQRRDNPFREAGVKPQAAALEAAQSEPVVQNAGWIVSMDVDEFLNIHAGDGKLADLYAAVPKADAISITWRLFGNADIDHYEDRPVIEQFTRCAPQLIRRPHQAWGFKTLFRNNGLFTSMGVHRPKGFQGKAAMWVNGSGRPLPKSILRAGWRSTVETYGYDLVTLNHYSVRKTESFLVKRDRGRVNHVTRDQGPGYWLRMNNNDEADYSILRQLPGLRQELERLMADPELAAAHAASVAAHRARIAELRADPDYAALYDDLTSDRMKRLSRLHRHLGMNVFLSGPSVIPDRVLDPDLPAGFFFNVEPPGGRAAE